jgi:hypothetical protein
MVELTIDEPTIRRPDPDRPRRVRAYRRIPEFGARWLRGVYEDEGAERIVITAFFDRGMTNADDVEI